MNEQGLILRLWKQMDFVKKTVVEVYLPALLLFVFLRGG